jgi:hypothetical protein
MIDKENIARYEVLKAKAKGRGGFLKMSKEEKREYQVLNTLVLQDLDYAKEQEEKKEPPAETPEIKPIPNDLNDLGKKPEETVTFTKSSLMKMMEEIRKEAASGNVTLKEDWHDYAEPKRRNSTAFIRVYQKDGDSPKGLMTDYRRIRTTEDPDTGKRDYDIYEFTIRYDGGKEEKVEMPLVDLVNINELEKVEIVQLMEKSQAMKQGETNVSQVIVDDLGNEITMDKKTATKVPLLVKRLVGMATVKRQNGEQFDIKIDRLNQ